MPLPANDSGLTGRSLLEREEFYFCCIWHLLIYMMGFFGGWGMGESADTSGKILGVDIFASFEHFSY